MQDFTKRMVIVVREDLPSWQAMNAVSHIAAYLGNKMQESFDTGDSFLTKEGTANPRNSQYAIIILKAEARDMPSFVETVRASGLSYLGFIREMIETTDDSEIEKILAGKSDSDIEYLGVGLFGPNETLKTMTRKFSLWK